MPRAAEMTLDTALNASLPFGQHCGIPVKEVPRQYAQHLLERLRARDDRSVTRQVLEHVYEHTRFRDLPEETSDAFEETDRNDGSEDDEEDEGDGDGDDDEDDEDAVDQVEVPVPPVHAVRRGPYPTEIIGGVGPVNVTYSTSGVSYYYNGTTT